MAKKKREKITYYDDDSTISDMSGVRGAKPKSGSQPQRQGSSLKEQWKTYRAAVKTMVLPMIVVLLVLGVLYLVISLVSGQ